MKLLLIGGLVGLAIGVGLTVFYFALADFFRVQARAESEMAKKTQERAAAQAKGTASGLK